MIKIKKLLTESRIVTESDFMKEINRAEKATGKKFKVPSRTKKLCMEVKKDGFQQLEYQGKKSGYFRGFSGDFRAKIQAILLIHRYQTLVKKMLLTK